MMFCTKLRLVGVGYTSHFFNSVFKSLACFFLITYHQNSKKHQRFALKAKNKNALAIFVLEAQKLLKWPKLTIFGPVMYKIFV